MPEISRFMGLIIKMLYMDNEQHHKPHIHVRYGEYKASIALDGELLAGELPEKQWKLISAWLCIHEDELYIAWNHAVQGLPFEKIAPLK